MKKIENYIVKKLIGEGGMAQVYLVKDVNDGNQYALKLLSEELTKNKRVFKRFIKEAKIIYDLKHPHIINVYGGKQYKNSYFILMEYIAGEDLKQLIKNNTLKINDAISYTKQITEALTYTNTKGILHRDIKPANILIEKNSNRAILTDFGIAKLLENDTDTILTRTGMTLGTPQYMSIEQSLGEQLDIRSDIYSLGIVFYEMLTGKVPFNSTKGPVAVSQLHIKKPIPILPPNLKLYQDLLNKMLAKKRENRIQSTSDLFILLDHLEEKSTLKTSTTYSYKNTSKFNKKAKKPDWILIIIVSVLVLSCAILLFLLLKKDPIDNINTSNLEVQQFIKKAQKTLKEKKIIYPPNKNTFFYLLKAYEVNFNPKIKNVIKNVLTTSIKGDIANLNIITPSNKNALIKINLLKPFLLPKEWKSQKIEILLLASNNINSFDPEYLNKKVALYRQAQHLDANNKKVQNRIQQFLTAIDNLIDYDIANNRLKKALDKLNVITKITDKNKQIRIKKLKNIQGILRENIIEDFSGKMIRIAGGCKFIEEKEVCLPAFKVGETEVTWKQFLPFAEENNISIPKDRKILQYPVNNINWFTAVEFTRWLSNKTFKSYRLPTKVEWEFMATSNLKTRYIWGDILLKNLANCKDCGSKEIGFGPKIVKSFVPNNLGIYDLHGNLWEWTCSDYAKREAQKEENCFPYKQKVIKGGGWNSHHLELIISYNKIIRPEIQTSDLGFRLLQEIK